MNRLSVIAIASMVIVLIVTSLASALGPESRILAVPGAPVIVTEYRAVYSAGGTYSQEGIEHSLKYQNVSTQDVVAVQFGLVSFDIWNEFLDRTGGVAMEYLKPQSEEDGTWVATAYGDFSFQTGVVYVSKVRFASGEIWKVDTNVVLQELKKIQSDFDAANLKKGTGEN